MSDIGPGTPLICTKASTGRTPATTLQAGALYTVTRLITSRDDFRPNGSAHCGWAWAAELRGKRGNFCGCRFRPLNGDDAELRRERDADPYSTGPSQDDADERVFKPIRPPVKVV